MPDLEGIYLVIERHMLQIQDILLQYLKVNQEIFISIRIFFLNLTILNWRTLYIPGWSGGV